MLQRPAESGNAAVLETMLACGFDPHAKDKDNVTALHRAAMGGHPEAVRVLLSIRRRRQRARRHVLGDAARLGRRRAQGTRRPAADHVAVARVLIAAGSSVEWTPPEGAPGPGAHARRADRSSTGGRSGFELKKSSGRHHPTGGAVVCAARRMSRPLAA